MGAAKEVFKVICPDPPGVTRLGLSPVMRIGATTPGTNPELPNPAVGENVPGASTPDGWKLPPVMLPPPPLVPPPKPAPPPAMET